MGHYDDLYEFYKDKPVPLITSGKIEYPIKQDKRKYVLKLDGNYYAGPNEKYADMFNISGLGALGAEQLTAEETEVLKDHFSNLHFKVEIEEYDAKQYMKETLEKMLRWEYERQHGEDCGYAIENSIKNCLEYLKQI